MPPPTLEQKLTVELRKHIRAVTTLQGTLTTLGQDLKALRQEQLAKGHELAAAAGSRDGLAILFLPAGMTLQQAWDQDYKNLRTGN